MSVAKTYLYKQDHHSQREKVSVPSKKTIPNADELQQGSKACTCL